MENLPVTLDGCKTLIIGWGRIGKCLAPLLKALGAKVTVAARKEADRAILEATGYSAVETGCIDAGKYRLIINTVPAPVLDDDAAKKDVLWIDLASKKGIFGENVLWARGLPGKDAPESSGELIARTVLRYLGKEQL
jgi:dipicolinate synthase subunit A